MTYAKAHLLRMKYLPIAVLLLGIGIMASGIANISYAAAPAQAPPVDVDGNGIPDGTISAYDIDRGVSIAGNDVPLPRWGSYFSTGGVIFEGNTADSHEGQLWAQKLSFDTIWTLPDFAGELVVQGQPDALSPRMVRNVTPLSPWPTVATAQLAERDEQCLSYETTSRFGHAFEWQDCISPEGLKAALIDAVTSDPTFKADLLAALQ